MRIILIILLIAIYSCEEQSIQEILLVNSHSFSDNCSINSKVLEFKFDGRRVRAENNRNFNRINFVSSDSINLTVDFLNNEIWNEADGFPFDIYDFKNLDTLNFGLKNKDFVISLAKDFFVYKTAIDFGHIYIRLDLRRSKTEKNKVQYFKSFIEGIDIKDLELPTKFKFEKINESLSLEQNIAITGKGRIGNSTYYLLNDSSDLKISDCNELYFNYLELITLPDDFR